ncbi:MAG: transposase [Acidobacteriota bacterium]|nr:transposase [Acidobacteriota bacterium]
MVHERSWPGSTGGTISSDGGAFLLRQTDQRLNLLPRLAGCFLDGRSPERIEHSIREMISQRVYGLALGYEDLNDHEQLRTDPVFGILAGREELEQPLAGKSTLNRMELGAGAKDRYKKVTFWKDALDELLVKVFIEAHHQMLSFLKGNRNKCKTILVEKTDRLYRNIANYATVDEFHFTIHFVKENVILSPDSRSSGQFIQGIKVLMARNYSQN